MLYVIWNISQKKWLAHNKSKSCYTSKLQDAELFRSREAASFCHEDEYVMNVEDAFTSGRVLDVCKP